MEWDVVGLGNALMDALVRLDDDALLAELSLVRGTMHPVDHARWATVYERVRGLGAVFHSGGSCANTIATVGRLGGRAMYRGQVGDDQMGHLYAKLMEKSCGGHRLRFSTEASTGKCLSLISAIDAERTMLTDLGAATLLSDLGPFVDDLRAARIAHFEGYMLLGSPTREVALEGMQIAAAGGARVSWDAADPFVIRQIRELAWSVITEFADIVFLNADEARELAGVEDAELACRRIAERSAAEVVVVKLGARGSVVAFDGELVPIPVFRVDAVDTTGAGDAYAGGFLYGWSRGWDPAASGRLASSVAALTVGQVGAVVQDIDALRSAVERMRPAA